MLMELNSMAAVQNKPTAEKKKQITHFLNYCASYLDAVTEYKRIDMILNLYSDASYLSKPDQRQTVDQEDIFFQDRNQ